MTENAFIEISLVLTVGTIISCIVRLLRQPLIIGYILTGVLVGPSLLNLVAHDGSVELFASIGIALLLFIIGLGLNPRVIRDVGKVAITTGVIQVILTSLLGFGLVKLITPQFSTTTAIYLGVALAFSSTIIVLKLLSDKKEQSRLYGKITIGFLLVQDLIATLALVAASANTQGESFSPGDLGVLVLKGIWLTAALVLVSTKLLPRLTNFIASSQEFLFLFALGWGFGVASLVAWLGFSLEVGALFAGVALAPLTYSQEVAAKLRPLRDFFLVLFFIALGSGLRLEAVNEVLPVALIFSVVIIVMKPLIVMAIMGVLGYTKKTSFKTGISMAQISEFSLIFLLAGSRAGAVPEEAITIMTVVTFITIAVSSYLITYDEKIFTNFERYLHLFERSKTHSEHDKAHKFDMILFGYQKGGPEFVRVFSSIGKSYVVVDYDPEIIDRLDHQQINYLYGDATDIELLNEIDMEKAKLIITTVTDHPTNIFLVRYIMNTNPHAVVICHSDTATEASELYDLGATYVMMPHYLGSEKIGAFIRRNGFKKTEFKKFREKHLTYLQNHHS